MNKELFEEALCLIDDEFLIETDKIRVKSNGRFIRSASFAACFCFMLIGICILWPQKNNIQPDKSIQENEYVEENETETDIGDTNIDGSTTENSVANLSMCVEIIDYIDGGFIGRVVDNGGNDAFGVDTAITVKSDCTDEDSDKYLFDVVAPSYVYITYSIYNEENFEIIAHTVEVEE